jgi:hypothetical protein
VASNGPWPLGTGRAAGCGRRGVSVADRWGRDDSRAQCQWWGAGGRGVSEAARFEMDSTIFIDSDGFKNLQTLTDSKSTFSCSKNVK